jgi:hypothetical protein
MGGDTTASGDYSTAMGNWTTAFGSRSTAMGQEAAALGDHSFAIGLGNSSGVSGTYPQVSGASSMGIFMGDRINDDVTDANTFAIMGATGGFGIGLVNPNAELEVDGTVSATAFVGDGSGLTGVGGSSLWTDNTTYISSDSAHMVNDGKALPVALEGASGARMIWYPAKGAFLAGDISATDATIGIYSTAMGTGTTASGVASTAMGGNTTASGVGSTAMGGDTTASGDYSTAMGNWTTAFGSRSTAMGQEVAALGANSLAIGLGNSSGVSGTYPQVTGANSMGIFMGDRINDDVTDANTFALLGGQMAIGQVSANAALDVSGTVSATAFVGDGSGLTGLAGGSDIAVADTSISIVDAGTGEIHLDVDGVRTMTIAEGVVDVSATLKVAGTGSETCGAGDTGTIRFNPGTGKLQFCRP